MKNKAFTLIELLVVVLIIGILAAIVVPQYQKAVIKSKYSNLKNITNSIFRAEQNYYLANNVYADTFDKLDISVGNGSNTKYVYYTPNHNQGCWIEPSYIYCFDLDINLSYIIYFIGYRICHTYNNDKIAHEICREETNKLAPDYGSGTYLGYYYSGKI